MAVVRSSTSKKSIEHQSVSIDIIFTLRRTVIKHLQTKCKCDEMNDFSSVGWDMTF